MSTNAASNAPCLFPTLRCADADAMIAWLGEALGFRERVVYRDEGVVAHAELVLGASILMLGQERDDAHGVETESHKDRPTNALYVAVADVDEAFAKATEAGAAITDGLRDTSYGSREFAFRDPEGNIWSVGSYWPTSDTPPL